MPHDHDSLSAPGIPRGIWVNDTHSGLNRTAVSTILEPRTLEDVARAVQRSRSEGQALAIAGGRHAMGGQQFLSGGSLLDMRRLNRVRSFDEERGLLEVEAGILWPDVIRAYLTRPGGMQSPWGIRQKQTGADRLTMGGAVAANIHGRGLTAPPFVGDLDSLEVVTAEGELVSVGEPLPIGLMNPGWKPTAQQQVCGLRAVTNDCPSE